MPVMFVHGMPSNSRMWEGVIARLDRDDEVVAVDLPGFNGPAPEGWVPIKENYVDWLIGQIEALHARGGPVHLVGHDWGCLLTLRAASLRPELLRTITAGNGPIDEHWPYHALWESWNPSGAGERFMDEVLTPERAETLLRLNGFPDDHAGRTLWATREGRQLTLTLYRSAIGIGRQWAPDLARIVIPSLLIWGLRDMIVPVEIGRRMAAKMGAAVATVDAGHFWPYEQPEAVAELLRAHFARADAWPETILTQKVETMFD
ncbi:MAG: alpha/beta fold hydrolase [Sphingobium sp.]